MPDVQRALRPWVATTRILLYVVCALVLACAGLVIYGFDVRGTRELYYYRASFAPFATEPVSYTRETLLHPLVVGLFRINRSMLLYSAFGLLWWVLTLVYLGCRLDTRIGMRLAVLVLASLVLSPVAMTLHAWTGMPDYFTVFFTAVACFSGSAAVVALVVFLSALNHFTLAMITLPVVVGVQALLGRVDRRRVVAAVVGLAAGRGALVIYLIKAGLYPLRGRLDYALEHAPEIAQRTLTHPWATLWSLNMGFWLLMVWAIVWLGLLKEWRAALALVCVQVYAVAVCSVAEDTTRIFAVVSWAGILMVIVHAFEQLRQRESWRSPAVASYAALCLLSLCLPFEYSWNGMILGVEDTRTLLYATLRAFWL